jgi:Flp pilus assembly protein TadG
MRPPAGERGVAAVELALVMPLLAAVLLATVDLAAAAQRADDVEHIARAAGAALRRLHILPPLAANAAAANGIGSSTAGLANTAGVPPPNLPPAPASATVALSELVALPAGTGGRVELFWGCLGGTQRASAQARCPDGAGAAPYADIRVAGDVARLLHWPALLLPGRVEARTRVRLG